MANKRNVYDLRPHDGGGEPPDMEQRLRQLEQEVAIIKETMATKESLAKVETNIIKWNVGTIVAVSALVFAIIRFAGN
ncbi:MULTISPECIES: hypothetical protein [unclassified Halomonas]|uniref:hypothetical protein n=1 Tax=unclassified Halomonas TaxID=2609666 RepID=UPI0009908582|nr:MULTISPECIES: hypothetical protein [unclassified Halomonas]AQU84908.1 hypothetical protein B2G49_21360 [Halomonas sp. 'Soap Lake \